MPLHIGTAGWTLPKPHALHFPTAGTHLERYARTLNCVEINSSFHRSHMLKTWQRWAASTPAHFRFAVKAPKTITHEARLHNTGALLQRFFDEIAGLGEKLGPILIQLPPKLAYDEPLAQEFFTTLRELHPGPIALEPRHATWFTPAVNRTLRSFTISRVAADPPKGSPLATKPAGDPTLRYFRLHGAPRTYYSDYTPTHLQTLATELRQPTPATNTWIIFDNTALGHATANALDLQSLLTNKENVPSF